MAIVVVWDTWLKESAEAEGLQVTREVWADMQAFESYVSHELLVDQDAPGHIIALGRWRTLDDAERALQQYRGSEVIGRLTPLLARPRERWVMNCA